MSLEVASMPSEGPKRFEREGGAVLQELYPVLPLMLMPLIGNPINMAKYGVDEAAALPQQACPRPLSRHL